MKGDALYVGRVYFENQLIPGKVHVAHRGIYVGIRGEEKRFSQYEVLVWDPSGKGLKKIKS
jgi:hypothetical protein